MLNKISSAILALWLGCASAAQPAPPLPEHPVRRYATDLAPSADLLYAIRAKQSGLSLSGKARVEWRVKGRQYSISSQTEAMILGRILEAGSSGAIDAFGLAPLQSTEKRLRKPLVTTRFDRQEQAIRFTESDRSYPLYGGEQDRTSAIWQLVAVARAAPGQFKAGSQWQFFVAGRRDAETWSFKVIGKEAIDTPLGRLQAIHLIKAPPPDAQGQQLDIWLAPARDWYPVRLRFSDPDHDFIEQTLQRIERVN
ncbi:DUF3108 domain-containing protein [Herminiimonas sp. CN]|uniref:DUF3108 domain-containing protein n=1 Tax=Herminiimonas sp. CN TaxID=1349818 RepID=UPI0005592F8D|nr:DUF3108 domain-containing protein [Herminiimonas sp. CN]